MDTITMFPSDLVEMVLGFQKSQVIITAVETGIFDFLHQRKATVAEITASLNLNQSCAARLMNMCVNMGLLISTKNNQLDEVVYENGKEASQYLVTSSPTSIVDFVKRMTSQYKSMELLQDAVKHGQATVVEETISSIGQIKPELLEYNRCMMKLAAPYLAKVFDLTSYTRVCELAGGVGMFAKVLKQTYPCMVISVLEQPSVVDYALKIHKSEDINIDFIKGDMLTSDLPSVDLIILAHVSMCFDDKQLGALFLRVFDALPQDGAFMVCEALLDEDRSSPTHTLQRDIAGLVVVLGGERTISQYTTLLNLAGFTHIKSHVFPQSIGYDVLMATKM